MIDLLCLSVVGQFLGSISFLLTLILLGNTETQNQYWESLLLIALFVLFRSRIMIVISLTLMDKVDADRKEDSMYIWAYTKTLTKAKILSDIYCISHQI